ncbi:MAG: hypothetical protein A2X86_10985 [Bdellovibrionales bacterium GWA2_49_15]|nr:MAG: hypothetical protein A2X86_10985 [Bdellovibrionales bacterium GWA2_49_15]HAZ11501.1 hypothetical protein [Bdellovibrionales bacterium]
MKKELNNKNIIRGFLREALFLDLEIQVEFDGERAHGRIVELNSNEDEALLIYINGEKEVSKDFNTTVKGNIFFKNFVATFSTYAAFWRMPFLMLAAPKELTLSNERNGLRFYLEGETLVWSRVLLSDGQSHVGATFKPLNLSSKGIGGELNFPAEFNLKPNCLITGHYWYNNQWIKIRGQIRSVRQLTPLHDETIFCLVGIENEPPKSQLSSNLNLQIEKRKENRTESLLEIDFHGLVQIDKQIKLKLINVSVSGFLLEESDPMIQEILISSKVILRENSSLEAGLVSYNKNQFRFQWIGGNENDRLKWLKEISKFIGADIDPQAIRREDILTLFCQSGALSDQYVKEQRPLAKEILNSLRMSNLSEPWIFRWTNRDEEGKAKAYVSAMKTGDNSWSLIDLVSDRYANKMATDFLPKFFVAMMEFSLTLNPCPKHFTAWVNGHKFLKPFDDYLHHQGKNQILAECFMMYSRLKTHEILSTDMTWKKTQIFAQEFQVIGELRDQLYKEGLLEFADLMDFNANNFSSPKLQQIFGEHELPFRREYWRFTNHDGQEFLGILTLVPEGQNPGRFIDSIFVFDLNSRPLAPEEWNRFQHTLLEVAASGGFSQHAIRRLVSTHRQKRYESEITELKAYALHPQAWQFYRDKTVKNLK